MILMEQKDLFKIEIIFYYNNLLYMLALQRHYDNDEFLKILNERNITSPIEQNYKSINDYIFEKYDDYDKYKIISNTLLFIDKLKTNLIMKNKIKSKKRKRHIEDDIKKIRCYCCNKDITKLYNEGKLFSHDCFNN